MKKKLWWIACVLGSVAIAFLRMPQGIFNPAYMVGYIFGMIAMCFLVAGIAFVVSLLTAHCSLLNFSTSPLSLLESYSRSASWERPYVKQCHVETASVPKTEVVLLVVC